MRAHRLPRPPQQPPRLARRARGLVRAAGFALALAPAVARAEDPNAHAEGLFAEGRALLERGNFAEACPILESSQALEPAVGTLLNLALCYEKLGRSASAWAAWRDAALLAERTHDPQARQALARKRAAALEGTIPHIVLKVTDPELVGLAVTKDGAPLDRGSWSTDLVVDPGVHTFTASAPGKRAWTSSVKVDGAASVELVVPPLDDVPAASPPPTPPAPPPVPPPTPLRTAGWIATGAGVATAIVGIAFGLSAKSQFDQTATHCTDTFCDAQGSADRHDAVVHGNVATGVFVGGLVVAAGGAVLWILGAPRPTGAKGMRADGAFVF
jgi:hypothetical protein